MNGNREDWVRAVNERDVPVNRLEGLRAEEVA